MEKEDREFEAAFGDGADHVVVPPPLKPKDPRSKYKYNIFSRMLFLWLEDILFTGCRRDLQQSDLYAHPSEVDSQELLKQFNRYWQHELERRDRGLKPRLWVTIAKVFWWRLIVQAVMWVLENAVIIGLTLVLGNVTRYFSLPCDLQNSPEEIRNVYLYATGMVLMSLVVAILHSHGFLLGQKIGMMCRIMATSAIYQKMLSLSQVTIGEISVGHIVNLASNDVQRFDLAFIYIHTLWLAPCLLIVSTYVLYLQVWWAAFVPSAMIVLQVPIQLGLAKLFSMSRFMSAKKTDQRVRIMNEVITGIRVIKMYAWEYAFRRVVKALRKHETRLICYGGIIRSLTTAFAYAGILQLLGGFTFIVFVAVAGESELTSQRLFSTLALLFLLRRVGGAFLVTSIFSTYEANVAVQRIQKFLLFEEVASTPFRKKSLGVNGVAFNSHVADKGYFRPESPWLPGTRKVAQDSVELTSFSARATASAASSVIVSHLTASWKGEQDRVVLRDVSFHLDQMTQLLAIVGPVGAGKSTLLQCLLGELGLLEGTVEMNGRISYASQDPWVFTGSVRENILFGHPYQKEHYNRVIAACALNKDIDAMISGDLTLVGERGVTLSGGQKARVNLARAVYHEADIYLLDDPLSAVDAAVGKHLFEECIRGLLKDKIVILVTHQVHFALQGDKLLVLNNGGVQVYGTHAELSERNFDTTQLLGLIRKKKKRDEFSCEGDEKVEEEEDGYKFHKMVGARSPCHKKSGCKNEMSASSLDSEAEARSRVESAACGSIAPPPEEKSHGSISMKTYVHYFRAGGSFFTLFCVLVLFLIAEASIVITDWWIADWVRCVEIGRNLTSVEMREPSNSTCPGAEQSASTCSLTVKKRLITYSLLIASSVLLNLVKGVAFYLVCNTAARVLHDRMFEAILRIPVLFFDTNPSGRVLNRFSKDVGFLDDLLPNAFLEYLILLLPFMAILVIASAANPYILIPLPLIILFFLAIRWYFLKASRSVKRLEAIARSPVYSHISTTLQGLPTIRTFGQQGIATSHFHTFNNEHSQGWYLFLAMTRWFGLRLDIVSIFLLIAVAFVSIPLVSITDSALLGLGLTYSVSLAGMFQYCVRQSTEVENVMISTERIMEYSALEPEASLETSSPNEKPPEDWPSKGELCMEDVAFRYSPELPMVLKNLNFSVRPSEKVGIVGRTGAGKSSLLSVLYRLAEPYGQITIDGVDTKTIGLHDLRKKMSIIPQDPVLFSGSMRYNLDPFDEYSDAQLWEVLEQVQLKAAVKEIEGQLSGEVTEGGSNFSVGQRQLVCLARALLRKNKILILDEATANVDPKTDSIIQEAIHKKFTECTVLTIAHRLNTIMDSDRILVMSNGQVKEFASPYQLLQNPQSLLYQMVEKTGPEASQKLHEMAHSRASRMFQD